MVKNGAKIAAKGLIFLNGKYLLMLRSAEEKIMPSMWDIPGGRVEEGETILEALIREIKEEAGIDISSSEILPVKNWMAKKGKTKIGGTDFLCILKKSQKIKLSPEHIHVQWFSEKEIMNDKEMPGWIKESTAAAAAKLKEL